MYFIYSLGIKKNNEIYILKYTLFISISSSLITKLKTKYLNPMDKVIEDQRRITIRY